MLSCLNKDDISCPVYSLHTDTIPALLPCPRLLQELPSTTDMVDACDTFSPDERIQKEPTDRFSELLSVHQRLL